MPLILRNINNSGGFNLINNGTVGSFTTALNVIPPSGSLVTTASLVGSATVASGTSPFAGGGNSYYTPGTTTSYVYTPGQVGYAFGTDDFTIEWFQYMAADTTFPRIFWYTGTVGSNSPNMGVSEEGSGGTKTFYFWNPSPIVASTTTNLLNTWVHYALVRISSRLYVYQNGTILNAGGTSLTTNFTSFTSTLYLGTKAAGGLASEQFNGYITNFRIVKQLGVYTGNFTKPTSALTAVASANPYGGSNTQAIPSGFTMLLLVP